MSKRIDFVPAVHVELPNGQKLYVVPPPTGREVPLPATSPVNADGSPRQPQLEEQFHFLLERLTDPEFVKGIGNKIEAQFKIEDARGMLKRQRELAATRGYWLLEDDDVARRLLNATMEPSIELNHSVAFNFVPFMRAVRDMTTPSDRPAESRAATASA